jgi:alkylation response protein AidB-like acyl-CoA dehydrogenase
MELNQECTLLQNELRKFAQQVILDTVEEFDKTCNFPLDNIKKLAEMGILGAVISEDMGGAALDTMGLVVSLEEISKVCSSTALIVTVHNALFAYPILKFGSDEMKNSFLPKLASGEITGGYADSNTNELEVKKEGNNYILNGKNSFVLNVGANGPFIIFLPTDDKKNLTAFLVDDKTPGIKREQKNSTVGMRASGIGEIVFENSPVPSTHIIGEEHDGSKILQNMQDLARICLSAIALGIAQGATDAAVKYAKERIQFNTPIIEFGMVREKIADMSTKIEAGRLLIYDAAMKRDTKKDFRTAGAVAKYFSAAAAVEITTSAIQIYGGYGYMKDYPVERFFRDAQVINVLCSTPFQDKEQIVASTI